MTLQPVRGTKDLLFDDFAHMQQIQDLCFKESALFGYAPMATPIFEFTSVFHRLGETSDVVSKETYTFEDRGGESLSLRPEGTAPVVRAVLSNGLSQQLPLKLSYAGPMFRYERPQKGRQRQFHQFGIEFMGPESPLADAEVILLGWQILQKLGVDKGITLRLNSLGCSESRATYTKALVAYLETVQKDLSEESQARLHKNPLRVLDSKDKGDQALVKDAPRLPEFWTPEAKQHFDVVCKTLDEAGVPYQLDSKLVRGLDYYCHTAFEFLHQDLGAQAAVIAGGRYNGLAKDLGGPDLSAVGWGLGFERLQLVTKPPQAARPLAFIVPISEDEAATSFAISQKMRQEGLQVQMLYDGSLKKQLKKIAGFKARYALLCGAEECKAKSVLMKDLDQGTQESVSVENLAERLKSMDGEKT
ncbi:histidine--tRNA ligase [Alphaproteobacteria bacterium]|nr:histidine--tRNA ligase [Alphaproteobacteria bacterium]